MKLSTSTTRMMTLLKLTLFYQKKDRKAHAKCPRVLFLPKKRRKAHTLILLEIYLGRVIGCSCRRRRRRRRRLFDNCVCSRRVRSLLVWRDVVDAVVLMCRVVWLYIVEWVAPGASLGCYIQNVDYININVVDKPKASEETRMLVTLQTRFTTVLTQTGTDMQHANPG